MQKQQIVITVGQDGNFNVSVIGTKGASCLEITKDIIKSLGIKTNEKLTTEAYEKEEDVHITNKGY
jgi:Protein of unknown function (DUF2997)